MRSTLSYCVQLGRNYISCILEIYPIDLIDWLMSILMLIDLKCNYKCSFYLVVSAICSVCVFLCFISCFYGWSINQSFINHKNTRWNGETHRQNKWQVQPGRNCTYSCTWDTNKPITSMQPCFSWQMYDDTWLLHCLTEKINCLLCCTMAAKLVHFTIYPNCIGTTSMTLKFTLQQRSILL